MSRGYDGPEIDDFRDSGWERERASSAPKAESEFAHHQTILKALRP
jgi:hypothetical protein